MYKALYVQELGSGDAHTFTYECADYEGVRKIKPPNDRAGDIPLVRYSSGDGWKVACYVDERKNSPCQSWRDWDAVFDSPQGQRNRRLVQ